MASFKILSAKDLGIGIGSPLQSPLHSVNDVVSFKFAPLVLFWAHSLYTSVYYSLLTRQCLVHEDIMFIVEELTWPACLPSTRSASSLSLPCAGTGSEV